MFEAQWSEYSITGMNDLFKPPRSAIEPDFLFPFDLNDAGIVDDDFHGPESNTSERRDDVRKVLFADFFLEGRKGCRRHMADSFLYSIIPMKIKIY